MTVSPSYSQEILQFLPKTLKVSLLHWFDSPVDNVVALITVKTEGKKSILGHVISFVGN